MRRRITALSITALLVVAILTGCGGAESRRAAHIARGKAYFEHGDLGKASVEFRNAMQIAPKDPEARLWAARAAEKLDRPRDAVGLFQSVLELSPDNEPAQVELGELYGYVGAPKLALKVADAGLAKRPNDAELLTIRGSARSQLHDTAQALADAQRAVQIDASDEKAVALLAALYRNGNDALRAAALVRSALKRIPRSTDLREVLTDLDARSGNLTEAEDQLRQLITLKPQELRYRGELAELYARSNRLDEGQRVFEDAVKALPHSDDAKLALAQFVATHRSLEDGANVLRGFITDQPDNFTLRLGLGSLLESARSMTEAIAVYTQIVQQDRDGPNAIIARDRIARVELVQGHLDDAQTQVAAVLEVNPRDDEALALRGTLSMERNEPANAIADLRAVLRDEPGSSRVHRLLAHAFLMHGEAQLAEDELRSAIENSPQDAALRIDLADFYSQTHRPDQGIQILEQSVKQLPGDLQIREALFRAYLAKGDLKAARSAAEDLETALPQSPDGPYLAGIVAQAQNRFDDAERDYQTSLQKHPEFGPLTSLIHLQLSRGEASKARANLEAMVARNPTSALALEMLGEVYIATKAYPRAVDVLSRAVKADPRWEDPYRNLAVAKIALGDTAGAIRVYQAGIDNAADVTRLAAELGSYYEHQKRIDDAIALYDRLYRRNPQSKFAAVELALLLATYKTDSASLERARDLASAFASSSDGALLDTSGWVALKRGDLQRALELLQHAAAREPNSQLVRFHLAMAELKAGQRDRARADLEAALQETASFLGADEARSTLAGLKANRGSGSG